MRRDLGYTTSLETTTVDETDDRFKDQIRSLRKRREEVFRKADEAAAPVVREAFEVWSRHEEQQRAEKHLRLMGGPPTPSNECGQPGDDHTEDTGLVSCARCRETRGFAVAQLNEATSRLWKFESLAERMAAFHCSRGGADNGPCSLNESEDVRELCLPHLAKAVLSGRRLTNGELARLG